MVASHTIWGEIAALRKPPEVQGLCAPCCVQGWGSSWIVSADSSRSPGLSPPRAAVNSPCLHTRRPLLGSRQSRSCSCCESQGGFRPRGTQLPSAPAELQCRAEPPVPAGATKDLSTNGVSDRGAPRSPEFVNKASRYFTLLSDLTSTYDSTFKCKLRNRFNFPGFGKVCLQFWQLM